MENYQEPSVQIEQQFTPAAPAVGIPQLVPGNYGPAFNVYEQAGFGSVDGINSSAKLSWLGNALLEKPVYNNTLFSSKIYDRFSVRVFMKAWGERISRSLDEANFTKDATGISFQNTPRFVVGSDADNAGGVTGTTSGFMPYSIGEITTALAVSDKTLIDTAADFVNAKIQPGQTVHILLNSVVDFSTTVKRVKSATELELDTAPGVASIGNGYTVGSDAYDGTAMEDFFDLSAAFLKNNVQPGDVLSIVSNQGLGSIASPASASIKQILNDTWVKVCIVPVVNRNVFDITQLDTLTGDSGLLSVTQTTSQYSIERYFYRGVSKGIISVIGDGTDPVKYVASGTKLTKLPAGLAALITTKNVIVRRVSDGLEFASTVTASGSDLTLSYTSTLADNDVCKIFVQQSLAEVVGADKTKLSIGLAASYGINTLKVNDIALVTYAGGAKQMVSIVSSATVATKLVLTLYGAGLNQATSTVITSVEFFSNDWTYTSDAFVTYRAAKYAISGKAYQYNSVDDISSIAGNPSASDQGINEYNDIAYAALLAFNASGGKSGVIAITDGSAQNEAVEYAKARTAMGMIEVYAQAFCTDSVDINAAVAPYCNAQSAPEIGQERVGYVAYNWEEIMLVTSGNADAGTGVLNDATAHFNDDGVALNDAVVITDVDGVIKGSYSVAAIISNAQIVLSDDTVSILSTDTYTISKGNKTAQANVIKAISESLTDRRVTQVWTGDFEVTDARFGTRILPGWFACAAMAGWNAAVSPSQGFTNSSIPGFIATPRFSNKWFGRDELNIIAGGGTLILTQAAAGAGLVVRDQLTTNDDSDKTGQDSIRRQVDVAAKVTRSTYKIYVGKSNIEDEFINFLSTEVWNGILDSVKKRRILKDMTLLEMKQNPNRLTGVIAKIKVDPFYPMNDMYITLII